MRKGPAWGIPRYEQLAGLGCGGGGLSRMKFMKVLLFSDSGMVPGPGEP